LDGGSRDFLLLFLVIFLILVALVCVSRDPEAGVAVKRSVLAGQIMAFSVALDIVAAALGQSARAGR
jgi:hypothetical protein